MGAGLQGLMRRSGSQGVVQSCMGSLSYNVELEGGHQQKVHVDHVIRQAPSLVRRHRTHQNPQTVTLLHH